jgi:DNA-binding transcriptional ArsR family regulator
MQDQLVEIFRALGDKTRLEIVEYLWNRKEVACSEISEHFSLSQPTMSHHYSKLKQAGILTIREEGVKHFYSIDKKSLKDFGIDLKMIATMKS